MFPPIVKLRVSWQFPLQLTTEMSDDVVGVTQKDNLEGVKIGGPHVEL